MIDRIHRNKNSLRFLKYFLRVTTGPEIRKLRKLSTRTFPRLCPSPSPASLPFPQAGRRAPGPALWWVSGRGEEVRWDFGQLQELSQRAANVLAGRSMQPAAWGPRGRGAAPGARVVAGDTGLHASRWVVDPLGWHWLSCERN